MTSQSINLKSIIIILGLLLSLGVVLLVGNRMFNLLARASGSPPEGVQIGNITANSASVTFTTTDESQALIEYGTNPTNLTLFASDETSTTNHTVKISLLTPNTTYYFHIKIGDKTYENSGLPWTFTTTGVRDAGPTPTRVPLTPSLSPSPQATGSSGTTGTGAVNCNDIAKLIGATKGSPNYDPQYDINKDGIINSADLTLCGK